MQMTISHVYKKITEVMQTIENVNLYEMTSSTMRRLNQKSINQAYKMLDELRAEMERESIRNKQKTRRVQMIDKSDLEQMSFLHKEIEDLLK